MSEDDLVEPEAYFLERGLLPPSSFPSPDEVRNSVMDRSIEIFNSYGVLEKILDRHEETIRKRWLKKTK